MNRIFSHAAFKAAITRFVRPAFNLSHLRRFGAIVAITVLLSQIFILPSKAIVFRNVRAATTAPISAPPEPFVVGATTSTVPSAMIGMLASFGEYASNGFNSALAFIASAKNPVEPTKEKETVAEPMMVSTVATFDYDNDGKTDIGRRHPANSAFDITLSGGGTLNRTLGAVAAKPAPGDFDGDGAWDYAVFHNGTWSIKYTSDSSSNSTSITPFTWGSSGDIPVAADYGGDGITDAAVFRPSTSTWWIKHSEDSGYDEIQYGTTNDIPVPADYDRDGTTDIAVFRPSTGDWYVYDDSSGNFPFHWGQLGDVPVMGDYDGDSKADPAIFRPSDGSWWPTRSGSGYDYETFMI